MRDLSVEKLAELEETIKLRRERDLPAAVEGVRSGRGRELMDEIRTVVREMQARKEAEFAKANARAKDANVARTITFMATALVNLAFLVFGESFGDEDERLARKAVIVRFPQLMRRQVSRMTTVAEAMTGAVRTVLERDPAWGPDAATPQAAEMLLGMCMTGLRSSARHEGSDPETVRERVVAMIRDTAGRISRG